MTALIYQNMNSLFKNWRTETSKYFADQIEWEDLLKSDENKSKDSILATVLGYISFGCFVAGVGVGLASFFTK